MKKISWVFPLTDQLLVSGNNFVLILFAARKLPKDEMGLLSYIVVLYGATILLNNSILVQKSNITIPKLDYAPGFILQMRHAQVLLALIISMSLGVLFVALAGTGTSLQFLPLAVAFLLSQQVIDFRRRMHYILRSPQAALLLSGYTSSVKIVAIILIPFDDLFTVLVILVIPNLPHLFLVLHGMWKTYQKSNFLLQRIIESRWLILTSSFSFLWARSPVLILGVIGGPAVAGIFLTVRSITNAANLGLEITESFFAPKITRLKVQSRTREYNRLFIILIGFGVIIWFAGFFALRVLGEDIIAFLLNDSYVQYCELLQIFWLISFVVFLFRLACIHFRAIEQDIRTSQAYGTGLMVLWGAVAFRSELDLSSMASSHLLSSIFILISPFAISVIANVNRAIKQDR